MELRLSNLLKMLDDPLYLRLVNKSALSTNQVARARLQKQHITFAEQRFGAILVKDNSAVHPRCNTETNPGRHIRFYQAGNNRCLRPLSSQNNMNTNRSALLCKTNNIGFYLLGRSHHQIGKLIDYYHNIDKSLRNLRLFFRAARIEPLNDLLSAKSIILSNILYPCLC
ncbi:hypothetical protein ES703_49305 [subsurface metagenome]